MRKPDRENIYRARRAARFGRLVSYGRLDELDAEHWLAAWEREAETRGLDRHAPTFWREGESWIKERNPRATGRDWPM